MTIDLHNKLIDAHTHVWREPCDQYPFAPGFDAAEPWLPRFTPDNHAHIAAPFGVVRMNLVQITWYALDHSYILDLIQHNPERFVGTGIVPAYSDVSVGEPDKTMIALARRGISAFRIRGGEPPFKRFEHPGYDKMFTAAADHNLPLSFLGPLDAVDEIDAMCARFPDAPLILDHLLGLGLNDNFTDDNCARLLRLAEHPRVTVKFGPIHAMGSRQRPFLDVLPILRRVVDAFGPQRIMYESDSGGPILMSDPDKDFPAEVALIRDHADFLSDADKTQILYQTAEDLFFNR
ncbi:MAG: amidohydrolase [Planctomycetaceae bacterium]|nr:amidohydrolase [Planctomycetaceae bacterium]